MRFSRRRLPKGEASLQTTMMEMFRDVMLEQQRSQQQMYMSLLEQKKEKMAHYGAEMVTMLERREPAVETPAPHVKLPKPTLQKLSTPNDIEHFIATFKRIAQQQGWPEDVWATQVAGLLTGKEMAT